MKKPNQQGLSSIMFAMAFVTILALVAIGFATIARQDVSEVLDRTLSTQSQKAAESGIEDAIEKIRAGVPAPAGCSTLTVDAASGTEVTCLTWGTADSDIIVKSNVGYYPRAVEFKPTANYNRIEIKWTVAQPVSLAPTTTTDIPDTLANRGVLRIAMANMANAAATHKVFYSIASSSSSGAISPASPSGASSRASCVSAGSEYTCTTSISTNGQWYLSLASVGKDISRLSLQALNAANNPVDLADAQYVIDSNAVSNDTTKRLRAGIPYDPTTWLPNVAVSARQVCKDVKIDGANNNTGISGDNTCANRL